MTHGRGGKTGQELVHMHLVCQEHKPPVSMVTPHHNVHTE